MRLWTLAVPILGTWLVAGMPVATYLEKQRHEQLAIDTLGQIHQAQERLRAASGGYATDVATLVRGCEDGGAAVPHEILDDLASAGYVLQLRAAVDATVIGQDCAGRPLASDYYVSAAPRTAWEAAGKAFAGRAGGQLFVFVDGIPPREADLITGLSTPVDALDAFRIP
jgi:hypothetical protein